MAKWGEDSWWKAGLTAALLGALLRRPGGRSRRRAKSTAESLKAVEDPARFFRDLDLSMKDERSISDIMNRTSEVEDYFNEMDALRKIDEIERAAAEAGTRHAIASRILTLGDGYVDLHKVLNGIGRTEPEFRPRSLVAARIGPDNGRTGHPSFMVLPADNPKQAARYLQRWSQFGVANSGRNVTFVPLSSVDPATDPRNTLFSGDAYTRSLPRVFDELYGTGAFEALSHQMKSAARGHVKTDGSPLTDDDMDAQVQRRASDMVTSRMLATDPRSYNPRIPGLRRFDGISEVTRKAIYDKFGKDSTYAEAKLRRVLGRDEVFTVRPARGDYNEDIGAFTGDSGIMSGTDEMAEIVARFREDAKGGKAPDRFALSRNFLATDKTPDTLFGIPVVADRSQYTPEDLAFFRKHPEAGGYYDMGDGEEAPEEPPMQAASKAGDTWTWETYRWNPEAKGGRKIDPKNIKGTGVSFDAAKERLRVPKGREAEFEGWMDSLANLPSTIKANGRNVPIKSFLVPKDWRTNTEYDRDYDYVAAFLADAKPGPLDHGPKEGWFWHMGDTGKMPTHPTFSRESYYARDPRYSDLAGDWEGETYLPGKAERAVRQDNNGGKAKRNIPPIVKGPIHYGPPPPPSRGKYPGIANNPGNVEKHERRTDKTLFKGEIAGGVRPKRFANFSDPVDGLTAAATVLSRRAAGLASKGLPFTIENYVPGYAPKSENDVEGYIGNLSRYSGFARDEELDPGNVDDMAKLLKNVVRFESGVPNSEWFTDDEYRQAALAMQEGAVD